MKLLDLTRRLLGLDQDGDDQLSKLPNRLVVKAMIPPSAFTKKGPGVDAQLRQAIKNMTPAQRQVAREAGWIR